MVGMFGASGEEVQQAGFRIGHQTYAMPRVPSGLGFTVSPGEARLKKTKRRGWRSGSEVLAVCT